MKPKYNIIVKVDQDKFLKYHNVINLKKFAEFLDLKHTGWKYFNVYDKKTGDQVKNYTKNDRPL